MRINRANLLACLFAGAFSLLTVFSPLSIRAFESEPKDCLVMRQSDGSLPDAIDDDSLIVLDYGSFVLVNLRATAIEELVASGLSVEDLSGRTLIRLGGFVFDPVDGPGFIPAALRLNEEERAAPQYVIVQWRGPLRRDFLDSLESAGARLIQYIPDWGMLIRRGQIPLESLLEFDFVRAITPYEPAFKVERVLLEPLGVQMLGVHCNP